MPVTWKSEACDQPADPESGALIFRFTQSARHSINIYGEQPYTSPDGRRIAIMRSEDADPRFAVHDLYVADLYTLRIQLIARNCTNYFSATSGWSGIIYYLSANQELMRVNLMTLEREMVMSQWEFPQHFMIHSVSPDQRFLVGHLVQEDYNSSIIRIDLQDKSWKVIFSNPGCFAGHLQYSPAAYGDRPGSDIGGMMHRGRKLNHWWHMIDDPDAPVKGTTYYVIDNDGGNFRPFPAGEPNTLGTGHSAWVGKTGRYCFAAGPADLVKRLHDPRWPEGNLFTAAAGDAKPTCFKAPEHMFNHVSVSRCGTYFICDTLHYGPPVTSDLVIGNFKTGKYRTLVTACGATNGGPACSHAHPYMTADNKFVVYNADPYLIGQVFAAKVPDGFLAGLD